ncbi:TPA: hypothetical protein ROX98_000546 [Bacillus pseudomycoides]|nr:hypothetical protein [Bacillus pseudomycoides]
MDILEILKAIGPFVAIIVPLIALIYNMYFKVKNIKDYDKIFIKKEDVHKINSMHSFFRCLLCIFIFYLFPSAILAISYRGYNPEDNALQFDGWSALFLAFIFVIFSLFFLITLTINLCSAETKIKYRKINTITSSISLISSIVLFPFIFYAFIFGDKSISLLYFIVCFPIALSIMILNIYNFYNNKIVNNYIVEILDKDTLRGLHLIHSHKVDDNTTILYEKNTPIEEIFYLCNFASNVYLKYTKNTLHLPEKKN